MSRVIADGLSKRATATTQEAEDAVEGKYPDAAGVHVAFNQYGLGGPTEVLTDPNVHLVSGFYGVSGSTNNPGFSTYNILASRWGPDGRWVTQLAQQVNGNRLAHRAVQSGTGSYTGWTELYTESNILGTVSQSAGVPTGAIIERGSNANGEYVKFADGTLICSINLTQPSPGNSASGVLYFSGLPTWTFPVAFSSVPKVTAIVDRIVTADGMAPVSVSRGSGLARSNSQFTSPILWWPASSTTVEGSADLVAVGRWF